ncbi:prenyltransferase [Guyparkeria sp.]|uniref:prenyltransferase n=1 Tax=Guyparkeria sp. TaxID=2035736 RepID=UPI0039709D56
MPFERDDKIPTRHTTPDALNMPRELDATRLGDHALQRTLLATRPRFLLLALVAAGIGLAAAHASGLTINPPWAVLTLVGAVVLHAAANVHNDLADDLNGSDAVNEDRQFPFTGGSRMIQSGLMTRHATQRLAGSLYTLTIGIGLVLLVPGGWPLLVLGVAGLMMAWAYSAPMVSLNARGLGEVAVGIGFGIVIPLGADTVQRGDLHTLPIVTGVGFALMTTSLLLINQFPDFKADRLAGKRHLVVRLGRRRARYAFLSTTAAAYLAPALLVALGHLPVSMLAVLLALPLSLIAGRDLWVNHDTPERLRRSLAATVAATLLYGSLTITGLTFA